MPVQPSSRMPEQLAQEAHAAYKRGDDEWFKAHLSAHNPIMLGSDPDEPVRSALAARSTQSSSTFLHPSNTSSSPAPRSEPNRLSLCSRCRVGDRNELDLVVVFRHLGLLLRQCAGMSAFGCASG